jgi:hypothetical protein
VLRKNYKNAVQRMQSRGSDYNDEILYRTMYMVAHTVDYFIVKKNPVIGIRELISIFYCEMYVAEPEIEDKDSWNVRNLNKYLKRGELDNVKAILRRHPYYNMFPEVFKLIENCLNPALRIFGSSKAGSNESAFLHAFEGVKRESKRLLIRFDEGNFRELEDLRTLIEILAGKTESFMRVSPTWIELILLFFMFDQGVPFNYDPIIYSIAQGKYDLQEFDKILQYIICTDNMHLAVQKCLELFPLYFTVHIIELLLMLHRLPLEIQPELDNLNYAEFYYLKYILSLIHDKQISFQIPCDYLLETQGAQPNLSQLLEYAMTVRLDEDNIQDMVKYCNARSLPDMTDCLYKILTHSALHSNSLLKAMIYSSKVTQPELRHKVELALISKTLNIGIESMMENFIKFLPKEVATQSMVVNFFIRYSDYKNAIYSHDFENAGGILLEFVKNKSAPDEFWGRLLKDSIPILLQSSIVYKWEDMLLLLECLENASNRHSQYKSITDREAQFVSQALSTASLRSLCNREV